MRGRMTGKDERCTDFIFIDGNENDLRSCRHEDQLMSRVWRLSKPPSKMRLNEPTITARRICRQNRLIRGTDASVRQSAGDNAREKGDKGRGVKDPCGCCDACPRGQNRQKKAMSNE
ncbi:uncharacterized protein LOC107038667 [Diachasma alloeum]|uniref:uncharacterized protein LOC107038667 n=1 Tax=Diachasma alloeum TaxID=454923 RepID=UPI00073843E4|nr:uncharacterized protein LOC107038667 [Diachasma alloeum]